MQPLLGAQLIQQLLPTTTTTRLFTILVSIWKETKPYNFIYQKKCAVVNSQDTRVEFSSSHTAYMLAFRSK